MGRILAFTDIHNDWHTLRTIAREEADAYICAGDLTFAERGIETAKEILDPIKDVLYIVPGNNERPETLTKYFPHVVQGTAERVGELRIGGIGGSPRTPWHTVFEWDEDYAYRLLERMGEVHVFISHAPPAGTELAKTSSGTDAGSKAVRWYIEEYQPRFAVVGHVHERAGLVEHIGETIAFNPGPRGKLIEINQENEGLL